MSFFKDKHQFIFLTSVLGLGLVMSISGFVVLFSRADLEPWQPWTFLAVGLMLTVLLLAYMMVALGRTATVKQLVGLRTVELSQANEQLLEEAAIRKQVESRLQRSEAGLRAILDATVDGIITIDEEGTIESFNTAAEIIGENVKVLVAEPSQYSTDGCLCQYMANGANKGLTTNRENEGRHQGGTTFPMDIAVNEVQLADWRLFTGIVRDVSERKNLEGEIDQYTESLENAYVEFQQLDELKYNLLSSVSHELRTPLTAIKG